MTWSLAFDLLGVFCFAISGSLLAVTRGYDIVGSVVLGSLTGLGGGVLRDLVLGITPTAFDQPVYMIPPLVAAALVFFLAPEVQRFPRTLLVFDAAGLGLFCTAGTIKALQHGMNPAAAALLGFTTAIGGGLLRDVCANRNPKLFDPRDIYALPALFGAAAMTALWHWGAASVLTQALVAVVVFAIRVLSLRLHWRVPLAAGERTRPASA
ncbi:putative membrane protein YeiH [Branchiibius hedensis]|uniref:Uncharacterized membrane protein YeiH n=1 Tax=Branchiibius hedensis TaxID=672460 RepID=A0A2Y9A1Q5_9MICO|nr:TRIC cation channel family protein [Branchiibius hedensis]PWJ27326.1 putative membrane protein YeiH [Branchiibius hedensis]SSA36137.1 Uncharacterized membrane protein YeiH [Branchiibius hedensis]